MGTVVYPTEYETSEVVTDVAGAVSSLQRDGWGPFEEAKPSTFLGQKGLLKLTARVFHRNGMPTVEFEVDTSVESRREFVQVQKQIEELQRELSVYFEAMHNDVVFKDFRSDSGVRFLDDVPGTKSLLGTD